MIRVLVGCEYSGRVRDAFRQLYPDWRVASCDLAPSEGDPAGEHFECDIRDVLEDGEWWDCLIVHPSCTYMAGSGLHWNGRLGPWRQELTDEALDFVRYLLARPIPFIGLENPVGCISTQIREPDQIIHPWQFGHREEKTTCLWLKNLPKLIPTKVIRKHKWEQWDNRTKSGQDSATPSDHRKADRSLTYSGIADAMAHQWGEHLELFA